MTDFLQPMLPDGWSVKQGEPFIFVTETGPIEWQRGESKTDGDRLAQTYTADSLRLELELERDVAYNALVSRLTLVNDSDQQSPAITRIQPLHLEWTTNDSPVHIRTIGGGLNESIYPPNTMRVETARCDGNGYVWMENGFDGRSSNEKMPLMTVSCGDGAVVAGLEWSGLWWMDARATADGHRLSCRIPVNGLVLDPGETLELPAAHFVFAQGGLDGATNACRRYIRDCIIPPLDGKRIEPSFDYNHWFGIGPDINDDLLRRQADRAAELGMEHFIIDAGWYGGCVEGNFETGVGNWELVDDEKFPNGLEPIAEYVRGKGLKLGLWFEVERAHRQSKWVREHPDWFFDTGRDYLHIDLANAQARRACVDVIQDAVERLQVKWLKLDYNIGPRPFWEKADSTGKIQFAYVAGLYAFFDELRQRHPGVVLENCASGGRRIDLGTLRHTHIANLTDQTASAEICRFTSNGANYLLPANAHVIGLPFGSKEVGSSVHATGLEPYDIVCRMAGMPTLYGDIAALGGDDVTLIRRMIRVFDAYKDLLQEDFYPLTPQPWRDDEAEIVQFCHRGGERAVVLVFPGYEAGGTTTITFRGLDPDRRYSVSRLPGSDTVERCGAELMQDGLVVDLVPRSAQILLAR